MIFCCILAILGSYVAVFVALNLLKFRSKSKTLKIAFFHPFWYLFHLLSNDGGGGYKVLWCIIDAILKSEQKDNFYLAIYSLVENKDEILYKVKNRFAVDLTSFKDKITIIFVPGRSLLIPQRKLTMVLHMILPIIYTIRCLFKYQPDVFYDTTGFASTLFLTKILLPTAKTVAYVHYPFISLDMIQKVKERRSDFNNDQSITNSPLKTKLKLFYYQSIFYLYKLNGYFVDFAQTNSSWTHNHMSQIWTVLKDKQKLTKLYPPCSVQYLIGYKKDIQSKKVLMMSLAQFRPYKNHKCQINTIKKLVETLEKEKINLYIKLFICGTTRGSDDYKILQELKDLTAKLDLYKYIEFKINLPFVDILKFFEQSIIGIHTMEAEHFGISVVEMLAAGLIVVAHNSAGPKYDIIKDYRFLASTYEDYYNKIMTVLKSTPSEKESWIKANRAKAQGFGEKAFKYNLMRIFYAYLMPKPKEN